MRTLKVALLGCGAVGSQVFRLLGEQAADLAARVGAPLQVAGVAVRDPAGRARAAGVAGRPGHDRRAWPWSTRPDVDIVVEMIGGIEPARSLLLAAMKTGKSVVTANKALLGADGAAMHAAAREHGADLFYEAAVAGAIPLLRPLRESLAGDAVRRVLGIVNGTTNYILDRMDYVRARSSARRSRRPRRSDTPRPTPPPTSTASTPPPRPRSWPAWPSTPGSPRATCTGRGSRRSPPRTSRAPGRSAAWSSCWRSASAADGGISARVHPAMIPAEHPLASVRGAYNAVFVEAESAGRLMFYGAGAGRRAHGQRRARRSRGGRAQPGRRDPRPGRAQLCRAAGAAHVRGARPATTWRWTWRTGPGVLAPVAEALRPARRVDQGGAPGGPRRRRAPGDRHPHRPGVGAGRDRRRAEHDASGARCGQRDAGRRRGGE